MNKLTGRSASLAIYMLTVAVLAACGGERAPNISSSSSGGLNGSSSSSSGTVVIGTPSDRPMAEFNTVRTLTVAQGTEGIVYLPEISGVDTASGDVYYTLSGADQAAFSLSTENGGLSFAQIPSVDDPHDSNGDNVYDVVLDVASSLDVFDSVSHDLQITVVEKQAIEIGDVEVLFPADQSDLGVGVDTTIQVVVRATLASGEYANIEGVTANDVELTRSFLEAGLWTGRVPVTVGQQELQILAQGASGEIAMQRTTLYNNPLPPPFSVSDSVLSSDQTTMYLIARDLPALLQVSTATGVIKIVSSALRGEGAAIGEPLAMALDEANQQAYVHTTETTETGAEVHSLIAIDLATGDRSSVFKYPSHLKLVESISPILDPHNGDIYTMVRESERDSLKRYPLQVVRLSAGAMHTIYDETGLDYAEGLCYPRAMLADFSANSLLIAHRPCSGGLNTVSRVNLDGSGKSTVVQGPEDQREFSSLGHLYVPEDGHLYLYSDGDNLMYIADLNAKTIVSHTLPAYSDSTVTEEASLSLDAEGKLLFYSAKHRGFLRGVGTAWEWADVYRSARPELYGVTDLASDEGDLAMISREQAYFWNPRDLASQSDWVSVQSCYEPGHIGPPGQFYTSSCMGGIAVDMANQRYFYLRNFHSVQDFYEGNTLYIESRTFEGEVLDSIELVYVGTYSWHGVDVNSGRLHYLGDRLYLDPDEDAQDSMPHLDLHEGAHNSIPRSFEVSETGELTVDLQANPVQHYLNTIQSIQANTDVHITNRKGVFVAGSAIGEVYHHGGVVRRLTPPEYGHPYSGFSAIAVDEANHLAYALSAETKLNGRLFPVPVKEGQQLKHLYAVSLLSGERVIMPGSTPATTPTPERPWPSYGSSSSSSSSASSASTSSSSSSSSSSSGASASRASGPLSKGGFSSSRGT